MDSKYPYETICEEPKNEWVVYKKFIKQNRSAFFVVLRKPLAMLVVPKSF